MLSPVIKSPILVGQTMVLLKKFLMVLAIALYSVVPVFAGDSDRARGHWQGKGAKMLNLKAYQHPAWGHLKKAHLEGMRAPARDLRFAKKRFRAAFQSGAGREGLISRYKTEYQIAIGRSFTRHQRFLVSVPSNRLRRGQGKGSGMRWDKGSGKSWGKSCDQSWGQMYGKNSNKRHGMGADKGVVKREDRSRGEKWQKNRKKKSFGSD